MPATIECVRAGVTTGEWASTLREVFGEYRAPTGLAGAAIAGDAPSLRQVRARVSQTADDLERGRLRILIGKPGLDGHSNGAEQIAVRARDAGFEVVYQGIRLTPAQIVAAAVAEDVDIVGLSVLSGSHLSAVPAVLDGLRAAGADIPVVVGGIIPDEDAVTLLAAGAAKVFTPKDFALTDIMDDLVTVIRLANGLT
jgi:(2R)-ethylmalonyl-CoA mutase